MSHAAEMERFMLVDERLLRIARMMRQWPCRRAVPADRTKAASGEPCWTAHSMKGRGALSETGPWIKCDAGLGLPTGALVLRGSKVREIHLNGADDWGFDRCVADVAGYCPPCRARERLLILRRLWTPKRTAALKSLRAAFKRSPACAPVDPPVHTLTAEQARALVRFAEADAALQRAKAAFVDASEVAEVEHEGDRNRCFREVQGWGGGPLRSLPEVLSDEQRSKMCDACQAAHRAFWRRHEAFRRRGSRLRILRPYFAQPTP